MRYYALADLHGFYTETVEALEKAGYFSDKGEKKLVILGDIFDRGKEAVKMQEFILDLMKKDEVILVKGNHEDLAEDLLNTWHHQSYERGHHIHNGTVDTVLQLTGYKETDLVCQPDRVGKRFLHSDLIQKIIPNMVDYFETDRYIFVHGWIPTLIGQDFFGVTYSPIENWREATKDEWYGARWVNGMKAWAKGVREEGKTVVCGHWHSSYGHFAFNGAPREFGEGAVYTPFVADGIMAIDACAARTRTVNVVVLDD